jgi:hypothetical protein
MLLIIINIMLFDERKHASFCHEQFTSHLVSYFPLLISNLDQHQAEFCTCSSDNKMSKTCVRKDMWNKNDLDVSNLVHITSYNQELHLRIEANKVVIEVHYTKKLSQHLLIFLVLSNAS